ncbi:MAG TPA: hypothetical protein VIJ00_06840, partial [Nakamurella sp.]
MINRTSADPAQAGWPRLTDPDGRINDMPPRRRAPTPTPIDVESVRQKLADGKIVRVGVSKSAQFPAGATGRVRRVGDPAVDGEEYVQVELTLNGTRDVLPFNPSDLTPATRGRPPGQSVAPGPARRPQVGTASSRSLPAPPPAAPGSGGTAPPTTPTRHLTAVGRPVAATAENNGDGLADRDGAGSPTAAAQSPGTLSAVPNRAVSGPTPAVPGSPGHGEGTAPPAAKPKPVRGQKRSPAVSIIVATSDTEPPH